MPAGFRLIGNSTQVLGDGQKSVTHLVFSDGLASVSVFVEPQSPLPEGKGATPPAALMSNMGSSTALSTEVNGHRVTTDRRSAARLRSRHHAFAPCGLCRGGPAGRSTLSATTLTGAL